MNKKSCFLEYIYDILNKLLKFLKKLEKLNGGTFSITKCDKNLIKTDKACFILDETAKELKITVERNDCTIKIVFKFLI